MGVLVSVKNVTTFGKLIGLLLLSLPLLLLLSVNMYTKNIRNELARLVMGTIFLVIIIMNKSQETTVFSECQKLTSAMKQRPEK